MPTFTLTSEGARATLYASTRSTKWWIVDEYVDEALNQEGEEYFTSMLSVDELTTDFNAYAEVATGLPATAVR